MTAIIDAINPESLYRDIAPSAQKLGALSVYFDQQDFTHEATAITAALNELAWEELAYPTD